MKRIEVEWSVDYHDCETCGWTCAEGAVVRVDGGIIMDRPARAHCVSGQHTDSGEVYAAIIAALGGEMHESGPGHDDFTER